jgi:hypothetical protein
MRNGMLSCIPFLANHVTRAGVAPRFAFARAEAEAGAYGRALVHWTVR